MELSAARVQLVQMLDRELRRALASGAPPAPVILVRAPGGLGKTRTTARLVRDRRVVWFGERIEMIDQLQQFLNEPLEGLDPQRGAPPKGLHIEKRPAREDPGMCANREELDRVRRLGLGRFEQKLVCKFCEQRVTCRYFQWRPTSSFLFAPLQWLALPVTHSGLFVDREIVVIDEACLSTVLPATTIERHLVDSTAALLANSADFLAGHAFRELFSVLSDIFRSPPPGRTRIELRRLLSDLGYRFTDGAAGWREAHEVNGTDVEQPSERVSRKAAKQQRKQRSGDEQAEPSKLIRVTHRDVRFLLEWAKLPEVTNKLLIGLFDALAADDALRPTCVAVLPRDGWASGIAAGRFAMIDVPAHLPIVVLDATGDERVYRVLFPDRPVRVVDVELEQRATVLQMTKARYPQSSLIGRKSRATVERLTGLVHWHRYRHKDDKIGVVVKKKVFDKNETLRRRLLEVVSEQDVQFFWSLRGKNELKDHHVLFVIGAPELPPLQIEGMCRAFMARSARAGNAPCSYTPRLTADREPVLLHVELQDGTEDVLQHRCLDHPVADLVFQQMHQAEIEQAILRIRPFEGDGNKTVILLTNMPLRQARLDIQYVTEDALSEGSPERRKSKLEEIRDLLLQKREEGRTGAIAQRELATWLGITEARISQLKKDHRDEPLLLQVLDLLRGAPTG